MHVQSTRIFKLFQKFENTHSVAKRLFRHADPGRGASGGGNALLFIDLVLQALGHEAEGFADVGDFLVEVEIFAHNHDGNADFSQLVYSCSSMSVPLLCLKTQGTSLWKSVGHNSNNHEGQNRHPQRGAYSSPLRTFARSSKECFSIGPRTKYHCALTKSQSLMTLYLLALQNQTPPSCPAMSPSSSHPFLRRPSGRP